MQRKNFDSIFTPKVTTKIFWNQFKNKALADFEHFKLMFVDVRGRSIKQNTEQYCDSNKECL